MPVNKPLRTLHECVMTLLTLLELPVNDDGLRQRVKTFILCNGFDGVYRAARFTAIRGNHEPNIIAEPWSYTVRVYNGNLARLNYLYTLSHWAESGLRSQLDLHYTVTLGETWPRDPRRYLDGREVNSFLQATRNLLPWEQVPGVPMMQVSDAITSTEFLERISLSWLKQMVLKIHGGDARRILVGQDGRTINYQRAKSLLEAAVTIRNAVAHNRYLTNEVYTKGEQNLLDLLAILHFDVAKALRNLEIERTPLIRQAIQRLDDIP